MYHEVYTPLQFGVSVQVSVSRFWLAPWIGINDGVYDSGDRQFAFGLGLGVDAYVARSGHRVGAYVDITAGSDIPYDGEHHYLSAGLAYRYW